LVNVILDAGKRKVTINLEGDKHTYDFFAFRFASRLPLEEEEVVNLCFVETFRDPLQREMGNQPNDEQDEELAEGTKGLEPQDGSVEEEEFENIREFKPEEP
jgi:hypothetical protein